MRLGLLVLAIMLAGRRVNAQSDPRRASPSLTLVAAFDSVPFDSLQLGVIDAVVFQDTLIAVLDADRRRVIRISASGRLLGIDSREGRGPGEIHTAFEIGVLPGSGWVVADKGNLRLTFRTPSGREFRATTTPPPWTRMMSSSGGTILLSPRRDTVGAGGQGWSAVYELLSSGEPRRITDQLPTVIPGPGQSGDDDRICVYCDVQRVGSDLLGVLDGGGYAIGRFDRRGRLLNKIGIAGYPRVQYSQEEAEALNAAAKRRMGALATDWRGRSKPTLPNRSIGVDGLGRIWVRPAVPAGELSRLDVFDRDGKLLSTLRVAPHLEWIHVSGRSLLGFFGEGDGTGRLRLFRIQGQE